MCNWTETKMKHVALYLEKEQAKAPSTYSDDVHLPNRSRPLELKENGNIQGCSSGLLLDFADFDFLSSAHNTLPPKLLWHFCRMLSCPGRTRQTPEQPNQSQHKIVVADLLMPIPLLPPGCQDENHKPISNRPQTNFNSRPPERKENGNIQGWVSCL